MKIFIQTVIKNIVLCVVIVLLTVMSSSVAFAHPPKDIKLVWNGNTKTLDVTSTHTVSDNAKHYVLTLTVFKNNKQILLKQYDQQIDMSKFSDSILLQEVEAGSIIRVNLICNIMGTAEAEITIP